MYLNAPQDTLAYQLKARPLTMHRDIRKVPLHKVGARISYMVSNGIYKLNEKEAPEREAIRFYMYNHAVSIAAVGKHMLEPLGDTREVFDLYHSIMAGSLIRAVYYTLIICVRESRHLKDKATMKKQLASMYGSSAASFILSVPDSASQAMEIIKTTKNKAELGNVCAAMSYAFHNGHWSSGYGGKKWGHVSDALLSFVDGTYTGEMFLDTVWTLVHNGGPIFNKGMFYSGYDGSTLLTILDVQRSGQIPQLVREGKFHFSDVKAEYDKLRQSVGGAFDKEYVDWYFVEQSGAVQSYPHYQQKQVSKYGVPDTLNKVSKLKAAKEAEKAQAHSKKFFAVTPNIELEKIKRKAIV